MATVIFYNFILFGSTLFVWLSEKGKGNLERYFFLAVAFLLVFVPAAIRYDVGADYLSYLRIFESSWELESYKYKEPLFYFANWFYRSIDASSQWLFATFSFIFTVVAFKAYPRSQAWLLHFLLFSMLWFFSFNGIRQAIALSWCLLALFNFFDKRYVWFFILTIVGSAFHQSAWFITAAGMAALVPLGTHIKVRIAPLAFSGIIVLCYFAMSLVLIYMEQILSLVGSNYARYFESERHLSERDHGTGLGVLVKVLFSVYIIWNTKLFVEINKRYWLLIVLTFSYAVGVVLANSILIFGRMADTFIIAPVVAGFLLLRLPEKRIINRLVLGCFLVFLVFAFIKDGMGVETSYSNPKRNPYKTVFSG